MEVREYTFRNGSYSFSILNLGCAVTSICTPDRDGRIADVTLPFKGAVENPDVILGSTKYYGLTVGRFANRIGGARFTLDGKQWSFEPNDGRHTINHNLCYICKRRTFCKHIFANQKNLICKKYNKQKGKADKEVIE